MSNFLSALAYVLINEQGYTNDSGGPTKDGITLQDVADYRSVDPRSLTKDDIKDLSDDEIKDIYRVLFWDAFNMEAIRDERIATCIFDISVNRGFHYGVLYAQSTLNSLGGSLEEDGILGSKTAAALNETDVVAFISAYEALVEESYREIVNRNPKKYKKYLNGWLKRASRLLTLLSD